MTGKEMTGVASTPSAAEKMGVPPEDCLVFEDGAAGIQAADAAGMASVFVPSAPGTSATDFSDRVEPMTEQG